MELLLQNMIGMIMMELMLKEKQLLSLLMIRVLKQESLGYSMVAQ